MQMIAAVDVGSNAIRMVVGEVNSEWKVRAVENIRLPVRLGQDAFTVGFIQEEAVQSAIDAFLRFRRIADDFGVRKMRAIATSAMREASNGDFLVDRIANSSGIQVEIIDGDEEARLVTLAIADVIDLRKKRAVLVDIGGGSVEVTVTDGPNIVSTESFNMGTVRLLNSLKVNGNHQSASNGSNSDFSLLVQEYAEAPRRRIEREIGDHPVNLCIGTGGNVEEMGKLRERLFKGSSDKLITVGELEKLIKRLEGMSYRDRIQKLKLRPDRADVILPATIVMHVIARQTGVKEVTIPDVGLKDGVLLELADELSQRPHPPRRDQVWESAKRLGSKYQLDLEHAGIVSKLAANLFRGTKELHNLNDEALLLLEVGALLHDVGHFINTVDHDKHGYYILKANHLIGLTEKQQALVANLVRYHRKAFPSSDDENFKALSQKDRLLVSKLSALMRLADGMDVSHTGRVSGVTLTIEKKAVKLRLHGEGSLMLEKWALLKRRSLFQEVFGLSLEIQDDQ
jgi:exopolyphosphatase / guanosine-5'-triphosphate,3'-diphosphate pyrophosphatase